MGPQLKKSQFSSHLIGKGKGMFTLEQAMKVQRGGRGIALLIL
jgi:hypothetical protein